MYGEVASTFFREMFEPVSVERVDALESLFEGTRGEPVGYVVCSLYIRGAVIEENLRRLSERFSESNLACYSGFPVATRDSPAV